MVNKKTLLLITLSSFILILGIYYVFIPDVKKENKKLSEVMENIEVTDNELLVAKRVELDSKRDEQLKELNKDLVKEDISVSDKNKDLEEIKKITNLTPKEEDLEKIIKDTYNIDCVIEISNNLIKLTCIYDKQDKELVNNMMNTIKDNITDKSQITIEFHK